MDAWTGIGLAAIMFALFIRRVLRTSSRDGFRRPGAPAISADDMELHRQAVAYHDCLSHLVANPRDSEAMQRAIEAGRLYHRGSMLMSMGTMMSKDATELTVGPMVEMAVELDVKSALGGRVPTL